MSDFDKRQISYTKCLIDSVRNTIKKYDLISENDSVLVALSGGADSASLLYALCTLRKEFSFKVAAAHLNHMLRGADADADEEYCRELCKKLDVEFHSKSVDVSKLARRDGVSEELAGRFARYEFFEELKNDYSYKSVATAHNKNDRAETVLMRIFRGTGIDGLNAVLYKREDGVIRPLLDVEREVIEGYCEENNIDYRTDKSNSDSKYTRNFIRNEIMPQIADKLNPSIVDTLCVLSDNAMEDSNFINGYAERLYRRLRNPYPNKFPVLLEADSLKLIDEGIRHRIYMLAAKETTDNDIKLERVHMCMIDELLDKDTGAEAELPKGLRVSIKYGWIEFMNIADKEEEAPSDFCYELEVLPIEIQSETGCRFEIADKLPYKLAKNQQILDYDKLEGKELSVRNRKFGDKIAVYEDGREKKLKDYFIDKKISRNERGKIPLLCADNEIAAVIGYRVSEKYKINKDTEKGLVITYEREG